MSASKASKIIVIGGPTGSGKSALAMRLAEESNGEIVSCDSVQIYKGFNIGSAKPTKDDQEKIPHHLIDIISWNEEYDAGRYAVEARAAAAKILAKGKTVIIAGGSGLYLRSFLGEGWHANLPKDEILREELNQLSETELFSKLQKVDPVRASEIHPHDKFRLVRALELLMLLGKPVREIEKTNLWPHDWPTPHITILNPPREKLHDAILKRTKAMLAEGLVEEVKSLHIQGCPLEAKPMQTIGYKQVAEFLTGALKKEELENAILFATRQYAKRQITWFKKVSAAERI